MIVVVATAGSLQATEDGNGSLGRVRDKAGVLAVLPLWAEP